MKNIKGIAYALISSSTFGLIPLFSIPVLASGAMGVPSLLFYRFAFATAAIAVAGLALKRNFKIKPAVLVKVSVLGIFYASTSMGLTMSYQYISSGAATTIHFLYPILVTAIMIAFFGEKASRTLIVASVLSIIGVALLSQGEGEGVEPKGLLLVLMTVVTYATYIVGVNKSGVESTDPVILTFYVFVASTALFAAYAWGTGGTIEPIKDCTTMWHIVLLALLPTVISDFTLILAIKYVGSTVTAILGSMEPLTAVLVGVFYFSESFSIKTAAGLALVLFAVTMVVRRSSRK
ncbi:MAG: EamA family transporter [Flavobacteriales bacterium]|nr:MAG: EamA family transporter [Flavobacteriales bacterium]